MVQRTPTGIPSEVNSYPAPVFRDVEHAMWSMTYEREQDLLRIILGAPRPAVSLDVDGTWLRIDPASGEVVGLEIPDFESSFVKKHPELQREMLAHVPSASSLAEPVAWVRALLVLTERKCA